MIPLLLVLAQTAVNSVGLAAQKKYQQAAPPGVRSYLLYMALTGAAALAFFSITARFRLHFNLPTLLYAAAYAAIVTSSIVLRFLAMARMNMLLVMLFSNAGAMLLPVVFGAAVFKEPLGVFTVIGLMLMGAAVAMPFLGRKEALRARPRDCLYGGLLFIFGGLSTILMKVYTRDARVSDNSSYCFLTNLMLFLGTMAALLVTLRRRDAGKEASMREVFAPRQCVLTLLTTVCSNVSSLLGLWILRAMAMSLFTMLSNSLNMASTAMLARLAFREQVTRAQVLSACCALLAVLCSLL